MKSRTCSMCLAANCAVLLFIFLLSLQAQSSGALTLGQIDPATAKRGAMFTEKIPLHLKAGFHVNSNAPAEEYLIPLRLTWAMGKIAAEEIIYPKPQFENYAFSKKPVSVFSGTFAVETRFKVAGDAAVGPATVTGKLRYQACNERECLPPKTIEIQLPVDVQ